MKKHLILLLAIMMLALQSFAGKPATLVIKYAFKGIEEGYDLTVKARILVNGKQALESSEHKQSQPQEFKLTVRQGEHRVRVEIWALYRSGWELHAFENGYSIDCLVDDEFEIKKNAKLEIVFDLDNDTSYEFSSN